MTKTKTTFTPGPWAYDPEIQRVYSAPTNRIVAAVFPADYAERAADIALIAAAPDMYAALEEIISAAVDRTHGGSIEPLGRACAKAAITLRRARGEG